MNFFNKIRVFLGKPFPEYESYWAYLRVTLAVSLFVVFFLYFFEPFDMSTLESNQFIICLGFGLATFIGTIFHDLIFHRFWNLFKKDGVFTFGNWILQMIGVILMISLANFIYLRYSFFGYMKWDFFHIMIRNTFAIGIFPVVTLGAFALLRQERKYQTIASEINQKKESSTTEINKINEQSVFNIPANQIRYVEALQNYVKIGYVSKGELKEQTERATLKGVLDEAKGSSIVKCHRSFLVNQTSIVSTAGNAQGLQLSLSDCDKIIPVSRSYVAGFRRR